MEFKNGKANVATLDLPQCGYDRSWYGSDMTVHHISE